MKTVVLKVFAKRRKVGYEDDVTLYWSNGRYTCNCMFVVSKIDLHSKFWQTWFLINAQYTCTFKCTTLSWRLHHTESVLAMQKCPILVVSSIIFTKAVHSEHWATLDANYLRADNPTATLYLCHTSFSPFAANTFAYIAWNRAAITFHRHAFECAYQGANCRVIIER